MPVDKFGGFVRRIVSLGEKGAVGPRGPPGAPGIGFILTEDGDYNIGKKLIKHVGKPLDETDVATKAYVDTQISICMDVFKDEIFKHMKLDSFVHI